MIEWLIDNPQIVAAFGVFMSLMTMLLIILGVIALIKYLASPIK